jgi:ribonuclease HI
VRHARSVRINGGLALPHAPPRNDVRPQAGTASTAALTEAAAIEIWTDGACRGNPGPGGWGALLLSGEHRRELHGGALGTTNNRMELTAVIEALAAIKRPSRLVIHTDSQYVKLGITEWIGQWQRRGWKTAGNKPVKNVDLWQRLAELASRHRIEWRWVPGHAGVEGNERADALANQGIDEVLGQGRG